jgi:hypothetical protein
LSSCLHDRHGAATETSLEAVLFIKQLWDDHPDQNWTKIFNDITNFLSLSVCTIYLVHRHNVIRMTPFSFVCGCHRTYHITRCSDTKTTAHYWHPVSLERDKTEISLYFQNCLFSSVAFWALADWYIGVHRLGQVRLRSSKACIHRPTPMKAPQPRSGLDGCVYFALFSSFFAVYCFNLLGAPGQQG